MAILMRQFRNIYKKASMQRGDTSENLIGLLERRLDVVILELNLQLQYLQDN